MLPRDRSIHSQISDRSWHPCDAKIPVDIILGVVFALSANASAKTECSFLCHGLDNKLHGCLLLQPLTMIARPHVFTGKKPRIGLYYPCLPRAMHGSLLPMPTTTCLLTDRQDCQAKGDYLPFSSFPTALHQQGEGFKKTKKTHRKTYKTQGEERGGRAGGWSMVQNGQSFDRQHCG